MKKYILWLFVCVFGFIGFSSALNISYNSVDNKFNPRYVYVSDWFEMDYSFVEWLISSNSFSCDYSVCELCLWDFNTYWHCISVLNISDNSNPNYIVNDSINWSISEWIYEIYYSNNDPFSSINISWVSSVDIWWSCGWDCSSIDTNYCVENDLCPVPDNFSQLFINDLEFQSHPVINIEIPDYITWDYTWTDSWFYLYVWSWYDVDYINSIIDINSYRPDSQDFTNIFVSGLTLIFPYIILALFLLFVWKLLKRVFK